MDGIFSRKWKNKQSIGTLLLVCIIIPTLGLPSQSTEERQCPPDDYLTENGTCCAKCSPGSKHRKDCLGAGLRTDCVHCGKGEYTDQMNYSPNCRRCKECKTKDFEECVTPCTRSQNAVCRCMGGFYKDVIDSETYQCRKCTPCGVGERQIQTCTSEHNTACECEKDYYKLKNKCLPCRNCTAECKHYCPADVTVSTKPPDNTYYHIQVVCLGVGLFGVLLLVVVFVTYKATKNTYTKKRLAASSHEDSIDSTKALCYSETSSNIVCNTACPQRTEQKSTNLPDFIPPEINIPDLIYAVLELVPVQLVRQLARSLGVTDIEIERAEADHRACKEAHYQMLRTWAERGSWSRGGGDRARGAGSSVVLHRPLLEELLGKLQELHLRAAVQELEERFAGEHVRAG